MRLTATLSLLRQPSSVAQARYVLDTLLGLTHASPDCRGQLALLITEACSDAVRHSRPDSTVELSIAIDAKRCEIEVGNRGNHVHRGELTADPPDPLAQSGRGLPLIASFADSAAFLPTPPGNVLLRIVTDLT